jgi:hypothetical protein
MKDILPSMLKGEIVGNMAIAEMTQMVKVFIDGNRLVMEHAQEMLEHRRNCWKYGYSRDDADGQGCH